jgi:ribosomal protein S4
MTNISKTKKYKLYYKNIARLKVNPLNNNTFLKLTEYEMQQQISKKIDGKIIQKTITLKRYKEVGKLHKQKWKTFLRRLAKTTHFFQKYKPYTFNHYSSTKFASPGNSFKKNFKNDLLTKKTFSYFYGELNRKYLKKQMTLIYKTKQNNNPRNLCVEMFESRLDSVLKRAKFCSTIKDARQLVTHHHVKVNGKIETNYSWRLKQGDLIQIDVNSQKMVKNKLNNILKENFNKVLWPFIPNYLIINYRTLSIVFGNIKDFNFSSLLNFKNDTDRVINSYYRN